MLVKGDLYGTLCFADAESRDREFSEAERTFVELLTQWVSYELEQVQFHRELQRQNERLEDFASVVSHDLRNPLMAATGYLELARSTDDPDHLDEVEAMHARMEEIIDDVLAVARNGKAVESDDLATVALENVARKAWESAKTDGATLRVDADGAVLRCDEGRLRQLLENLFRNSVDHGGDGVAVRVAVDDDEFTVADDGPGIPPGERDDVFDRGYSTEADSTGFGLAIVSEIAEAHGWSVSVREREARIADERRESEGSGNDCSGGALFAFGNVDFA